MCAFMSLIAEDSLSKLRGIFDFVQCLQSALGFLGLLVQAEWACYFEGSAFLTKSKEKKCCSQCGKSKGKLYKCGKCNSTLYCSKGCQTAHHPEHKVPRLQHHSFIL